MENKILYVDNKSKENEIVLLNINMSEYKMYVCINDLKRNLTKVGSFRYNNRDNVWYFKESFYINCRYSAKLTQVINDICNNLDTNNGVYLI